ncbi:aminotransferase class III-fold pyridoxal phosphate-dependent enzyme [Herbiconiux sp. CPCC 205716]|uniref:Aminotransferase class III-fold pyridoxal phosphate-dependent enzyme n=1 Tax=Herbiconiux gentiana TaxID=2970912 RepID=A0ABT2GIB2_9MICO|nr:aminotransferase class III-fold pyridoxal phosphate-dependent enzyme [Herbiconiux gentiana]MCS5715963.1 aminotransferase class III-fold pyridoxal phosphate-dependent enzyme [Herbiconiux gentiana]
MTEVFDYFAQGELPTPTLGDDEVRRLFADSFGLEIDLRPLGSQQDQNFRVFPHGSDDPLGVLKLSNPVFSEAEIAMQDAAAAVVAERDPGLRIPLLVEGPRGPMAAWWSSSEGRIHARVIANITGRTLMGSDYLSPAVVERMGELSARVSLALADFRHPASGRVLQWNLRHAVRVIDTLLPGEPDAAVRALVERAVRDALETLDPVSAELPVQAGHFDITDDNMLRPVGGHLPDAVIDFGDVAESWRVGELATTLSSVLHHDGADVTSVLPAVRAFHTLRPLDDAEIVALWPLVVLRGAVLVLSGRSQVRLDEQNSYASVALDREFRVLETAAAVPVAVMTEVIRDALGATDARPERPLEAGPLTLPEGPRVELDAGTVSPLNDEGAWLRPHTLDDAAATALERGASIVTLPAWRPVLTGSTPGPRNTAATVPTGVTLWLAAPAPIAPGAGRVTVDADVLTWVAGDETVRISGLPAGATGHELPARTRLFVQRHRTGGSVPPARVTPELASAWRRVEGDPSAVIGVEGDPSAVIGVEGDPSALAGAVSGPSRLVGAEGTLAADAGRASGTPPHDLLERRHRVLAEVQEHYYATPPQIERGWREHLADVDGRVYLDMVNNVASVGHAHPHVVGAATRQLRLLNTNSRFHYGAIAEFAERLAALLPDGLDTVFFVNSGSEATDLAVRLAMASTGRPDIVAMREAYHGWTYASDAVSTSIADNPNALSTRPEWVHTVAAANDYRGEHRGADAARYAPEAVAVIDALAAEGRPPAGFISESYFGNAGGVALPDGYLREVYAAVRRHGGIAISDEVQVGFGRLGEWFWGFQQQDAVPDVVAIAKSIGGGQPVGAVVTSREIADRYRTGGYFFSSTGGSPVSAVIGMAVLDVIERDDLPGNARDVGGHLKRRLEALGELHEIVGRVHGSGLYLGLEFVRDRATLEPATEETAAICARLLELGVVMQPTGDFQNVLKIKPPLVITRESADFFVDALGRVLDTGW